MTADKKDANTEIEKYAQDIFEVIGKMLSGMLPGRKRWAKRMLVLMELERLLALNIKEAFAEATEEE